MTWFRFPSRTPSVNKPAQPSPFGVALDQIAELNRQLEEAEALAEAREVLRAKWEAMWRAKCEEFAKLHTRTDAVERELRGVKADLWMRDGQVEDQAAQIVALEQQIADLTTEVADKELTVEGLGDAMRDLEQAAAEREVGA